MATRKWRTYQNKVKIFLLFIPGLDDESKTKHYSTEKYVFDSHWLNEYKEALRLLAVK